tara:strand:- start:1401 stop:1553 length:153 start_codon:yes stop_codon:yes gene_type:complete
LDYLVDVLLSFVEVNAKVFNVFYAMLTEELLQDAIPTLIGHFELLDCFGV